MSPNLFSSRWLRLFAAVLTASPLLFSNAIILQAAPQDSVKAGIVGRDLGKKEEPASYRKDVPFIVPEEEGQFLPVLHSVPGTENIKIIINLSLYNKTSFSHKLF